MYRSTAGARALDRFPRAVAQRRPSRRVPGDRRACAGLAASQSSQAGQASGQSQVAGDRRAGPGASLLCGADRWPLVVQFADDPQMWVSTETIYQSLYVTSRGALRRELTKCLRTGRALRRPGRKASPRNGARHMINIAQRPQEADDRAVPGHWEGDLLIGNSNKSAIGTLVERATGYALLVHLPDGYKAEQVAPALAAKIQTLPDTLRRSLTWDQGPRCATENRSGSRPGSRSTSATQLTLAARHQREHQRAPTPVLPQRHRPGQSDRARPRPRRRRAQRPTPQTPRLLQAHRAPR
jgi:hypothetical protein